MSDAVQPVELVCSLKQSTPLSRDLVNRSVALARNIAQWNRNTTYTRQIVCVTDDKDVAIEFLSPMQRVAAQRDKSTWEVLGATWGRAAGNQVIWVNPDQNDESFIDTWAHELAHAVTRTQHGWTWRRMHIMLAPLVTRMIMPNRTKSLDVPALAAHTVLTYRTRRTVDYHASDQYGWRESVHKEVAAHVKAAERCHKKFTIL